MYDEVVKTGEVIVKVAFFFITVVFLWLVILMITTPILDIAFSTPLDRAKAIAEAHRFTALTGVTTKITLPEGSHVTVNGTKVEVRAPVSGLTTRLVLSLINSLFHTDLEPSSTRIEVMRGCLHFPARELNATSIVIFDRNNTPTVRPISLSVLREGGGPSKVYLFLSEP